MMLVPAPGLQATLQVQVCVMDRWPGLICWKLAMAQKCEKRECPHMCGNLQYPVLSVMRMFSDQIWLNTCEIFFLNNRGEKIDLNGKH